LLSKKKLASLGSLTAWDCPRNQKPLKLCQQFL
jgi:hypothetical protein